jgi:hypothetical protein
MKMRRVTSFSVMTMRTKKQAEPDDDNSSDEDKQADRKGKDDETWNDGIKCLPAMVKEQVARDSHWPQVV